MTTNNQIFTATASGNMTIDQLIDLFPEKIERASVWTFFDDGSIATDVVVETLDETLLKMVLPAEEVTVFRNGEDEVVLITDYQDCEVFSTLRSLREG